MAKSVKSHTYVYVIFSIGIILLIASILVHQFEAYDWYRAIRGLISFVAFFMLISLSKNKFSRFLAAYFLIYGASSIATIWYENNLIGTLSMILNLVAYSILICALIPKVSFKNMSWWLLLIFVLLILLNGYLLYQLIEMIKSLAMSSMHYLFMMLGSMSTVVVGFLALLYNFKFSSKASLIFAIGIFLIVFSEVFRAIAYYDFAFGNAAVYTARILLLLGTFLIVHFTQLPKTKTEELP